MGKLGYRPLRRGLTTGTRVLPRRAGPAGAEGRACALGRPRRPPARAGDPPSGGRTIHPAAPAARALARSDTARFLAVSPAGGWSQAAWRQRGSRGEPTPGPRRGCGPSPPVAWMPLLKSAPPLRNTTHSGAGPASSQGSWGVSLGLGPSPSLHVSLLLVLNSLGFL